MTLRERYEAETGKITVLDLGNISRYITPLYIEWLEAQLTWRPVSEKPEESGDYWVLAEFGPELCSYNAYTDVWQQESWFVNALTHWLPIPPMEEEK